jgi:hypothetical protein
MKISFDNDVLSIYPSSLNWYYDESHYYTSLPNTHWEADLDNGAIEKGSSGAPLLSTDKRVIGQLHGGYISCPIENTYYGRFDLSWTGGGTAATRFSSWLDPSSIGASSLNTLLRMTGPELVPCSTSSTVTYSISPGCSSVTWSVSSNLVIVSGQGTNQIAVRAASSSTVATGLITVNYTYNGSSRSLSRYINVGTYLVNDISGPSTAVAGGSGSSAYYLYTATPSFSSTYGDYEWSTSPSTSILAPLRNTCHIAFTATGSYGVRVRTQSTCGYYSGYVVKNVMVTSASSYSISQGSNSRMVTLTETGTSNNAQLSNRTVSYSLVNMETGVFVTSGQMPATGGTLDFNHATTGNYVLQIDLGNGNVEIFKLFLR